MITSSDINGHTTQLVFHDFADRVLVLVTQLGKVGHITQASIPPTAPLQPPIDNHLPPPSPAIHLTPLLGSPPSDHQHTLHGLYATQIATSVWTEEIRRGVDSRRSVVVGLALAKPTDTDTHKHETETFKAVIAMLYQILKSINL